MPITRYLSEAHLERMKSDFRFLIKSVSRSSGEIALALRDGYFNLYYRGNSLAKVTFRQNTKYEVAIHRKFIDGSCGERYLQDHQVRCANTTSYSTFTLSPPQLHPFFQRKHIDDFQRRIKVVNYCEETTFEQMVVTDNLNRNDILIIDRQITDHDLNGKRMDLLALKQIDCNRYHFQVIEVKLGNSPELRNDVATQLSGYLSHIEQHFSDYKKCYEKNYRQMREMELLDHQIFPSETIEIVDPVKGLVLVLGYSGMAKAQLAHLRKNHSYLQVIHHSFGL